MGLKADLGKAVAETFRSPWTQREGTVVPSEDSIKLGNDAVKLQGAVLYADLADSTRLVNNRTPTFAAEIYKTFLHCAAKIIRDEGGSITAYDGDRIMAVYIGDAKETTAVRTAMKIKYAADQIINPAKQKVYTDSTYTLKHVVGIDSSDLFVARTGVRGANDLVWVGRAANIAAKLAALPEDYATYITKAVYGPMALSVTYSSGRQMWESVTWNGETIYRSNWHWSFE